MSKNSKNRWKLANIGREFLHTFWTTSGNSMKFSRKMCLKIILKVTENQGLTLSLEDTFFKKPQGGGGSNWPPQPPRPRSRLRVNSYFTKEKLHFSLICSFCCCLVKKGWALKVAEQFAIRGLVAYKPVVYKKRKCTTLHVTLNIYL